MFHVAHGHRWQRLPTPALQINKRRAELTASNAQHILWRDHKKSDTGSDEYPQKLTSIDHISSTVEVNLALVQ